MEIHAPDPAFTRSERARANFRLAVKMALSFVGVLALVQLVNWGLDVDPGYLGLRPREWSGLIGILFAPLLHADFGHFLSNALPLMVLGTAMLYLYPRSAAAVLPSVYLGSGAAVWLFGRASVHLGASGLVYGLAAYVLCAGLLRRDTRAIAASLIACFMYGQLVWGVLPIDVKMSWETHLAAAVIGVLLAVRLRHLDVPPRRRYSWEDEPAVEDDPLAPAVGEEVPTSPTAPAAPTSERVLPP